MVLSYKLHFVKEKTEANFMKFKKKPKHTILSKKKKKKKEIGD